MSRARFQYGPQPFFAGGANALQMRGQSARFRETQQNGLRQMVSMQVAPLAGIRELCRDSSRRDYPANPQTRKCDFRKTANQYSAAALVYLPECGQVVTFITKVTVDVVL